MIAWVLVLYLGTNSSMAVSGIESEQECRSLIEKMEKERPWSLVTSNARRFPYRAAYRF